MNERWVFLNGHFFLEALAVIPITDRGFLFGDGIFTTIRVHKGKCELLKGHMHRLQQQAKALNFSIESYSFEWIEELIQRNQAMEGSWRLKIILTAKEELKSRTIGNMLATLHPYDELSWRACNLCIFPHPFEKPLAHLKSLSYLEYLYVRNYAKQHGYCDAITRTHDGILLETGCSNLFWIDQGICLVPDQQLPYLKGVFLETLLSHLSLPIQFIRATIDMISPSANVYICNALSHVRSVLSIENVVFSRNLEWDNLLKKAIGDALNP